MDNIRYGRHGEDLAEEYLVEEGYDILERNWRFKHNEVDIIARKGDLVIFVEVKTRSGTDYGEPYTAVDYRKQRYLIFAAERFLQGQALDLEVRFDIVSIITGKGKTLLEHISGAFRAVAR